jgi:hypothetical protein
MDVGALEVEVAAFVMAAAAALESAMERVEEDSEAPETEWASAVQAAAVEAAAAVAALPVWARRAAAARGRGAS